MKILAELRERFRRVLNPLVDDPTELVAMVRPAQDPRFGDYQANCAMPLAKRLGKTPRQVAAELVEQLNVEPLCEPPEIAGPGFINLRIRDDWLVEQSQAAVSDPRLGVDPVEQPRTYVIDFSSPNVAKPMHVGHIRSTVIGDALSRTLRFLNHRVITDNHLGDWGTQFGMIIYGYKHFLDQEAYRQQPVAELARLYRYVNDLVEYHNARRELPRLETKVEQLEQEVDRLRSAPKSGDKARDKKDAKQLRKLQAQLAEVRGQLAAKRANVASVESDAGRSAEAANHPEIAVAVLEETAKLHAGDPENRRLWEEFLPQCREAIQRLYDRINVHFDYAYGESFYEDQLADVVEDLQRRGLATESEGAICVFLEGFETPMIVRKKDGAFLYATTDLATIRFRMETWCPDAILYVVDHRQSEHFEKLFAAARLWGYKDVELKHVSFGTVLGEDGRPFKTRSGQTVGLEALLDEAVRRAWGVVCENDDAKPGGPELDADQRRRVAEVVGHAAIKYADLAHNRTSDYKFSYDKMLAMSGNTATYMQYSYARVKGIFAKGGLDPADLRGTATVRITNHAERALGLKLLQLADALDETVQDYRPNQLTDYLFDLTRVFFTFYEQCPVLKAESQQLKESRLLLCDLTARTIKQGLELLGIDVVEKM